MLELTENPDVNLSNYAAHELKRVETLETILKLHQQYQSEFQKVLTAELHSIQEAKKNSTQDQAHIDEVLEKIKCVESETETLTASISNVESDVANLMFTKSFIEKRLTIVKPNANLAATADEQLQIRAGRWRDQAFLTFTFSRSWWLGLSELVYNEGPALLLPVFELPSNWYRQRIQFRFTRSEPSHFPHLVSVQARFVPPVHVANYVHLLIQMPPSQTIIDTFLETRKCRPWSPELFTLQQGDVTYILNAYSASLDVHFLPR